MPAKTISHCQGKGSLSHNNRSFTPKNVDATRTADNITFVKQPIAKAYEQCFGEAVKRYNDKQKRADRQIKTSYFEDLFNHAPCNSIIVSSDKRKSFYEDLVQIGDKDDTGVGTVDGQTATKCLTEYMRGFSKRNPNMHVFNAVIHVDEATPHLHIDYIPVGHCKRGIDTQNGLAQALKEMGYGNGKDAINRWRIAERKVLEDICKAHELEISEPKKSRGYSFTTDEYKEYKDTITELKNERDDLQHTVIPLRTEYKARKAFIDQTVKDSDVSVMYPDYVKINKPLFGKETVTVPKDKWEEKHVSASRLTALEKGYEALEEGIQSLKQSAPAQENEKLKNELLQAEKVKKELVRKLTKTDIVINMVNKVFTASPELKKAFVETERDLNLQEIKNKRNVGASMSKNILDTDRTKDISPKRSYGMER